MHISSAYTAQQNLYQLALFYRSVIYTVIPMSYLYFYSKDHEIKPHLHASNVKIMLSEKIVCSVYSVCSCCNELYTCKTSVWSMFVHANAFMHVSVTCLLMRGSVRLTSQCLMEWLITSDFYSYGCSLNSDIYGGRKNNNSEVTGNNVRILPRAAGVLYYADFGNCATHRPSTSISSHVTEDLEACWVMCGEHRVDTILFLPAGIDVTAIPGSGTCQKIRHASIINLHYMPSHNCICFLFFLRNPFKVRRKKRKLQTLNLLSHTCCLSSGMSLSHC